MKKLKRALVWCCILNKRLLKKSGFILILALIPVCALIMNITAENDESGFLSIAVYEGENKDFLCTQMMKAFRDDQSDVFRYSFCETELGALSMLEKGEADMAWCFEDSLGDRIESYAKGSSSAFVTVYVKEKSAVLSLAEEKIFATLYPFIGYDIYENYLSEKTGAVELSEAEKREIYDTCAQKYSIVDFKVYGDENSNIKALSYITKPLKGMSAVFVLLCGLVSTLYFIADERSGVFFRLNSLKKLFVMWASNFFAVFTAGIFAFISFVISRNYSDFAKESLLMLLFILCCTAFCTLLGVLVGFEKGFCIIIPTVLVACTAFCPIFVDLKGFAIIQNLLPPYHYLYSLSFASNIYKTVIYFVSVTFITAFIYYLKEKIFSEKL
ncbi:MAG: hypothetical protein IKU52_08025 [Clostridia bacterium]|nr:hypothetical protein [Clostridia bacterium]